MHPCPETLDIIAIKRINIQTLLHNLHIHLCSFGHLHAASRLAKGCSMQGPTEPASHNNHPWPTQPALVETKPPGISMLLQTMLLVWTDESPSRGWLAWWQHGDEEHTGGQAAPAQWWPSPGSPEEEETSSNQWGGRAEINWGELRVFGNTAGF